MSITNENEELNGVAQIDQELGIQYCAGSREVYIDMLAIFLEQVDKYMKEVPEFYAQKDWKNYAIAVHALKSTSLTIGAKVFSEKAKEQELAAKAEEENFLLSHFDTFIEEYRIVVDAVRKIAENE